MRILMNLYQIRQEVDLNLLLRFGNAGSSSFLGDTGYTMMDPQVVLGVFEHVIIVISETASLPGYF